MINFEQHIRDLGPVDWTGAMDSCTTAELRFFEEQAAKYAALQHKGAARVGEALFQQVQQARALRVARQGRVDAEFWTTVEDARPPVEEPDLTGIPKWSEVSTPEVDRP